MESTWVTCPYCGESVEVVVDTGGGTHQAYIEDCEVCCRPWRVQASLTSEGLVEVTVERLDD